MHNDPRPSIIAIPHDTYKFIPQLYQVLVLGVFWLFFAFRVDHLSMGHMGWLLCLSAPVLFLLLSWRIRLKITSARHWFSTTAASILFASFAGWLYAGSWLVLFWVGVVVAGFLVCIVELRREWLRLRWVSEAVLNKTLSLSPIEADSARSLPRLFSWQTEINGGVLSQQLNQADVYRGSHQRVPIAKVPVDLSYVSTVLQNRTILACWLLVVPLFAYSSWYWSSRFNVGSRPTDIAIGDIDGDNDLDLITSHLTPSFLSVLLNDGTGRFAPYAGFNGGFSLRAAGLADVDGDGRLEAVTQSIERTNTPTAVAYGFSSLLRPLDTSGYTADLSAEGSSYTMEHPQPALGNQSWQAFGDLNQDGAEDAVLITQEGLKVFYQRGETATFDERATLPHPTGSNYRVSNVVIADLDKDGLPEIIVSAPERAVLVYKSKGERISAPKVAIDLADVSSFAVGDVTGDGWLDIVTISNFNQALQVYRNDQHGGLIFYKKNGENPQSVRATTPRLALGDLDGDGDLDAATTDFFRDQVRVFYNRGDGTLSQMR